MVVFQIDPFLGMSDAEKDDLTTAQVAELEAATVEKQAWKLAHEVQLRIHDAPGPHGFMSSYVTDTKGI